MKVLIVDKMHNSLQPLLANLGLEADFFTDLDYWGAKEIIGGYEGFFIRSKFFVDDDFLNSATKLKFIARAGAGLDLIDLDACKRRNIEVFGANEGNRVAVAEHLIGMILNLFNNIVRSNNEIRQDVWLREANRGIELNGKTVGVIGYGNNGSEAAKLFAAFGCKVLAYDKYKSGFGTQLVQEATLEEIFEQVDLVTLHFPLTGESKGWVNDAFFEKFQKNIYFCNVARGKILNTAALIKALQSGKVLGACLDVLENEKLNQLNDEQKRQFDFLKNHPKVLITPHVAGWTFESYEKINKVLVEKLSGFLKSKQVN